MTKSEPASKYKYRLFFVPSALQEWQGLDGSVKEPLRKSLRKRLDNPHVPGGKLHGELAGYYKIKLRKQGYRLVYGVQDDMLIVMVMAVDKREDGAVYRSVLTRLGEKVAELAKAVQGKLTS
ncbi:MAG: type II toxin-antitoxin system RelE/ParE family toxin [Propionivibrio sp.]